MVEFKINKQNLMPKKGDYFKIIISSLIVFFIFKPIVINVFPSIELLDGTLSLIVWVIITVYFKSIIDVKFKGRDWF